MKRAAALMAALLLAFPGEAAAAWLITQDGKRLSRVVDVWTLQEPEAPAAEPEEEEGEARDDWSPVRAGALYGAMTGCLYGVAAASSPSPTSAAAGGACWAGSSMPGSGRGSGWVVKWIRD